MSWVAGQPYRLNQSDMKTKKTLTWVASLSFVAAPAWAAQPLPASPNAAKTQPGAGAPPAPKQLAARPMPRAALSR